MTCAKFECAGWVQSSSGKRGQHQGFPGEVHASYAGEPECSCRCGLPWSAHSDAARGVEQPAQEAALPPISKWVLQDPGFMVSDAEGDWCEATTAEAWRTEALRQRERAEKAEAESLEQARLLGMGGEREAALMGKVERLEREMAATKAEHADALELMQRCANALRRHLDGHAPMRIPADPSGDSDLVLADVEQWLRDKEGA